MVVAWYFSEVFTVQYICCLNSDHCWLCAVIYSDDLTDAYFDTVGRILTKKQTSTTLVMSLERRYSIRTKLCLHAVTFILPWVRIQKLLVAIIFKLDKCVSIVAGWTSHWLIWMSLALPINTSYDASNGFGKSWPRQTDTLHHRWSMTSHSTSAMSEANIWLVDGGVVLS